MRRLRESQRDVLSERFAASLSPDLDAGRSDPDIKKLWRDRPSDLPTRTLLHGDITPERPFPGLMRRMGKKRLAEQVEEASSLQTLKNLNRIDNLQDRLATAASLCNHVSRADMILRWLAELLSRDAAARANPESWHLVRDTIRLLDYPRAASLLKSGTIATQIDRTLRESDESIALLKAVLDLIELLLTKENLSTMRTAKLITLDVEQASSLYEALLRSVMHAEVLGDLVMRATALALRVWDARKQTADGNAQFREHCWLVSAIIHVHLSTRVDLPASRKRKSSDAPLGEGDLVSLKSQLERLMSKHIYLPAKNSYARESEDSKELDLFDADTPFATALRQLPRADQAPVLTAQLDIALRCAPMVTHRQRLQESAWVDAVFLALTSLHERLEGPALVQHTMTSMLSKLAVRATLSDSAAAQVINKHSGLASNGEDKRIDWPLIARLITSHSHLFIQEPRALALFDAIDTSNETLEFMVPNIILPVCQEFASSRKLAQFLVLWEDSLTSGNNTVWLNLDCCLRGILEAAMPQGKLLDEVRTRLEVLVRQRDARDEGAVVSSKLQAAVKVLTALFNAVEQDSLLAALASSAHDTFNACLNLIRVNTDKPRWTDVLKDSIYSLLQTTFKVWFPRYTMKTPLGLVEDIAKQILQTPFSDAESGKKSSGTAKTSIQTKAGPIQPRSLLVATLCQSLHTYDGCAASATSLLRKLFGAIAVTERLTILVRFPSLASLLPESEAHPTTLNQSEFSSLRCTLPWAGTKLKHEVVESIRSKLFSKVVEEQAAYETLMEAIRIPIKQFRADDADAIIVTLLQYSLPGSYTKVHHARFALILRTLEAAPEKASAATNLDLLIKSVQNLDIDQSYPSEIVALLDLVGKTTARLVKNMSMKDIGRSARRVAENALENDHLENIGTLVVATALLTRVARRPQQTELDDQTKSAAEKLLKRSVTIIGESARSATDSNTGGLFNHSLQLAYLLDLAHALVQIIELSGKPRSSFVQLQKLATKVMTKLSPEEWDGEQPHGGPESISTAAVQAYRILCLDRDHDLALLAHSACRLLAVPYPLSVRTTICAAYRAAAQVQDIETKLTVARGLVDSQGAPLRPSAFVILNETLSVLASASADRLKDLPHPALLAVVLKSIRVDTSFATVKQALESAARFLRYNGALVNQYEIDLTMSTIHNLAKSSPAEPLIFPLLCNILLVLLTHHRQRLNGRFHILIIVLQALLSRLLAPHLPTAVDQRPRLGKRHTVALTRVITLLCEPPAAHKDRRQGQESDGLVDRDRKQRANVGTFVPAIVHSYCTLVLRSPPAGDVRESLKPAIAAMLGAMHVYHADGVKVLSSAMTDSERAVLRDLVESWRRTSKWTGI